MATSSQFAWSYSALNAFETCPRRFHLVRSKQVTEPQTEALLHGNQTHKALERHLKKQEPLPEKYAAYRPYADAILSRPGKLHVEHRVALNNSLRPTEYFASDVWVRGVIDVALVKPDRAIMFDWKTGAKRPNSDQMKLFAAIGIASFPYVQKVDTAFVWLQHGSLTRETFTRADIQTIFQEFRPRVGRIEEAIAANTFHPRPSGLCRAHCPVPKKLCEFSERL
jgi:hypothetical protein